MPHVERERGGGGCTTTTIGSLIFLHGFSANAKLSLSISGILAHQYRCVVIEHTDMDSPPSRPRAIPLRTRTGRPSHAAPSTPGIDRAIMRSNVSFSDGVIR